MNKLAWALQIVLALAFAAAGSMKLTTSKADLVKNPAMGWANDFSEGQIKAIGGAEVAGAIGLIAPVALRILPVLTPAAGAALAVLMGGAASTHMQRGEPAAAPVVLGLLSAAVAYLRFRLNSTTGKSRAASA